MCKTKTCDFRIIDHETDQLRDMTSNQQAKKKSARLMLLCISAFTRDRPSTILAPPKPSRHQAVMDLQRVPPLASRPAMPITTARRDVFSVPPSRLEGSAEERMIFSETEPHA